MSKIFCIGFNKTGTTSLARLFELSKFKVACQSYVEKNCSLQSYSKNFEALDLVIKKNVFFQDQPFSQHDVFKYLDSKYKNSKFILTIRDENEWFRSYKRFYYTKFLNRQEVSNDEIVDYLKNYPYLYTGYYYEWFRLLLLSRYSFEKDETPNMDFRLLLNKDFMINHFVKRNEDIKKYFKNSNKLFILDISKSSSNTGLANFLKVQFHNNQYPHENSSKNKF